MMTQIYFYIPNFSKEVRNIFFENNKRLEPNEFRKIEWILNTVSDFGQPTATLISDDNSLKGSYLKGVGFLLDATSSSTDCTKGYAKFLVFFPENLVRSYWPKEFPKDYLNKIQEEILLVSREVDRPLRLHLNTLNEFLTGLFHLSLEKAASRIVLKAAILCFTPIVISFVLFLLSKFKIFALLPINLILPVGLLISAYSLLVLIFFETSFFRYLDIVLKKVLKKVLNVKNK